MFKWYADAKVCYVYLVDLQPDCPSLRDDLPGIATWLSAFKACSWFKRGWTLQELLAPQKLQFHSSRWKKIASLFDLVSTVSKVTKIDIDVLLHAKPLEEVAIARRMSWASKRETSRIEDRAYSLLGIFDVNMPMLYGEKEKAFKRLQEEIIKTSSDLSIFAWEDLQGHDYDDKPSASSLSSQLLAASPANFTNSGDLIFRDWDSDLGFEMSKRGLHLNTHIFQDPSEETSIAILNCSEEGNEKVAVGLRLFSVGNGDTFVLAPSFIEEFGKMSPYVRQAYVDADQALAARKANITIFQGRSLQKRQAHSEGFITVWVHLKPADCLEIVDAWPAQLWNLQAKVMRLDRYGGTGGLMLKDRQGQTTVLVVRM